MSKAQFSFGNTKENTGMSKAKTIYSSQNRAALSGQGSDAIGNRDTGNQKNYHNFQIGNAVGSPNAITSEAQTQYVNKQSGSHNMSAAAQTDKTNLDLANKLKSHNFEFREQKQGGLINNYFQTSHNQTFNSKGNPNDIRSRVPDSTKAYARKEHFNLGYDKSGFRSKMEQTSYNFDQRQRSSCTPHNMASPAAFQRTNRSLNVTSNTGTGTLKENMYKIMTSAPQHNRGGSAVSSKLAFGSAKVSGSALISGSLNANKQKQVHISMGGAPSNQRSV